MNAALCTCVALGASTIERVTLFVNAESAIVVTFGKDMPPNPVLRKAWDPIVTRVVGRVTLDKKGQFINVEAGMVVNCADTVAEFKNVQPLNTAVPIDVTLAGMLTELSVVAPLKAAVPIVVTPEGIVRALGMATLYPARAVFAVSLYTKSVSKST